MKTSIIKTWLLSCSLLATSAFAGGGANNGGGAIVCRNNQNEITYAQVYDNWEHRDLGIVESNHVSAENIIFSRMERLKTFHPRFYQSLVKELVFIEQKVAERIKLDPEISLGYIDDAALIYLPAFCPNGDRTIKPMYEQLVNYRYDGEIYVSTDIFPHLSEMSKASIYLHEAIYKLIRTNMFVEESTTARLINAQILAEVDDELLERTLEKNLPFRYSEKSIYAEAFHIPKVLDMNKLLETSKKEVLLYGRVLRASEQYLQNYLGVLFIDLVKNKKLEQAIEVLGVEILSGNERVFLNEDAINLAFFEVSQSYKYGVFYEYKLKHKDEQSIKNTSEMFIGFLKKLLTYSDGRFSFMKSMGPTADFNLSPLMVAAISGDYDFVQMVLNLKDVGEKEINLKTTQGVALKLAGKNKKMKELILEYLVLKQNLNPRPSPKR